MDGPIIESGSVRRLRPGLQSAGLGCLGGILGGGLAASGLLLASGGLRHALAFAIFGALILAAAKGRRRPAVATAIKIAGTGSLAALALTLGLGIGISQFGQSQEVSAPTGLLMVACVAFAALCGAAGGEFAQRVLRRWAALAGLGLIAVAGLALGAGLGQLYPWATAKYAVWGMASGAGLGAALSGLLALPEASDDNPAGRRLRRGLLFAAVFIVLLNGAMPSAWDDTGAFNLYTYQASAFLRGRLDIEPLSSLDAALFEGKIYVNFFPFPAVLLVPIEWAQGNPAIPAVPMSAVSAGLGALSAVLLLEILQHLDVAVEKQYWIVAAFMFGTGSWVVTITTDNNAAFFAAVVSTLCLLLAIREGLIGRRGVFAGLFVGLTFLSRQITIFAAIFVAALVVYHDHRGWHNSRRRTLVGFAVGLGGCVVAYMLFNQLRFHNPLDTGYGYVQHTQHLGDRFRQYGLFNLAYAPSNLYFTFLKGFSIEFDGRTLLHPRGMDPFGTSLTVASPFLFLAVLGRLQPKLVWAAWASIMLMLFAHLLYFNNGWGQINTQRYMLDYLPILILLVGQATKRVKPWLLQCLVLYSIGLNLLALFIVPGLR